MESTEQKPILIELNIDLLKRMKDVYHVLSPDHIDLSRIKIYDDKFKEKITVQDYETFGEETYRAFTLLSDYKRIAYNFAEFIKAKRDEKKSKLFFTEALQYLEANKTKDSATARDCFIDGHPEYVHLVNLRTAWEALYNWLSDKKQDFYEKHLWVKKKMDELRNQGGH